MICATVVTDVGESGNMASLCARAGGLASARASHGGMPELLDVIVPCGFRV
jgi:hypothetical protein